MAFEDRREFVGFLQPRGEAQRLSTPVSCDREITEIADGYVKC